MNIDERTDFGQRVIKQLAEEQIIWLTTVGPKGTPMPTPVWFWWDGEAFLIYSRPNTTKLRNIAQQPLVTLNFNSDFQGHHVTVFTGTAVVDLKALPAKQHPDYSAKYKDGITMINMTPDTFSHVFSTAIRITPTKLRGH